MAESKNTTSSPTEGSMAKAVDSAKTASTPTPAANSPATSSTPATVVVKETEKESKDISSEKPKDEGPIDGKTPSQKAEAAAQADLAAPEDAVSVTAVNAKAATRIPSPTGAQNNPSIMVDPQIPDNSDALLITSIANTANIQADARVNAFYRKAQRKEVKLPSGKTHFYNASAGRVQLSSGDVMFTDGFYSTDDAKEIEELRKLEKATGKQIMEFKSEHREHFPEVTGG